MEILEFLSVTLNIEVDFLPISTSGPTVSHVSLLLAGQWDSTLGPVCSGLSAIWRKVHVHSHVHCYDRDPTARRCGPSHLALTEKIFDAWCIVGPSRGQPGAWPTGRVWSTRWAEYSAWRRLSVVPGSGCVRLLVLGLSEVIRRFIHICCLRAKKHLLIDTVW